MTSISSTIKTSICFLFMPFTLPDVDNDRRSLSITGSVIISLLYESSYSLYFYNRWMYLLTYAEIHNWQVEQHFSFSRLFLLTTQLIRYGLVPYLFYPASQQVVATDIPLLANFIYSAFNPPKIIVLPFFIATNVCICHSWMVSKFTSERSLPTFCSTSMMINSAAFNRGLIFKLASVLRIPIAVVMIALSPDTALVLASSNVLDYLLL